MAVKFEWDAAKNRANIEKHGISFETARLAFFDDDRVLAKDEAHSQQEVRYHCYGKVNGAVLTVRFTRRGDAIRIFGAAYWRKGAKTYEEENSL